MIVAWQRARRYLGGNVLRHGRCCVTRPTREQLTSVKRESRNASESRDPCACVEVSRSGTAQITSAHNPNGLRLPCRLSLARRPSRLRKYCCTAIRIVHRVERL